MEKMNQFQLDVDMMDMDGVTPTNQISTKSSEKVTAQHHRKEVEGKKASLDVQMVAMKNESEVKTPKITRLTGELRLAEQEIEKLKAQQQSYAQTLGTRMLAWPRSGPRWKGAGRETQGAGELRIEGISSAELASDRDLVNTELLVYRLAKSNDMCVANAMTCDEKSQRCAAEACSLRELKEA